MIDENVFELERWTLLEKLQFQRSFLLKFKSFRENSSSFDTKKLSNCCHDVIHSSLL